MHIILLNDRQFFSLFFRRCRTFTTRHHETRNESINMAVHVTMRMITYIFPVILLYLTWGHPCTSPSQFMPIVCCKYKKKLNRPLFPHRKNEALCGIHCDCERYKIIFLFFPLYDKKKCRMGEG